MPYLSAAPPHLRARRVVYLADLYRRLSRLLNVKHNVAKRLFAPRIEDEDQRIAVASTLNVGQRDAGLFR